MSIIDIILLVCFIPALIGGIRKGFISQVISIISIVAGIWMSFEFADVTGKWLGQHIQASENILMLVSFALIMIVVFIILGLIGRILEGILNLVLLGWLNRLLGVVFSLMKATLIIGLAIMVFSSINNTFGLVAEDTLSQSILYTPMKNLAYSVFPYLKELFFWK